MDYFHQQSERLKYRNLTEDDIPNWLAFFENNDRLHFLGLDLRQSKEALAEKWIHIQLERYEKYGLGHLAVELKETGEFIGLGGILPKEFEQKQEYEIAYSLKPRYWGKGYATEIATQMMAYGKKEIKAPRFISIIHIENTQSMNVARKNGMEALFRTEYLGMPVEVYGISNS